MREDCRHFQSRTYDTGEAARFCVLDLAPEAPWRCPEDCTRFEPDAIDGSFVVGSLRTSAVESEPDDDPAAIGAVLAAADSIVNAAGPEVVAEVERARAGRKWWQPWKRGKGDDGGMRLSSR